MNREVVITGANGFIGSALCNYLTNRDVSVRGLVRMKGQVEDSSGSLGEGAEKSINYVRVGDLGTSIDWAPLISGADTVVHLAGLAHRTAMKSGITEEDFFRKNVAPTVSLAGAMVRCGVARLVYVSSIGVYGTVAESAVLTPHSPAIPTAPYAKSKLQAERALRDIAVSSGLELVIVRPPLVYGPKNPGNFLRFLSLAYSGVPLPFGSLCEPRSFVFVENLASLLFECIRQPAAAGQIFLVRDSRDLSLRELIVELRRAMGIPSRVFRCPTHVLAALARVVSRSEDLRKLTSSFSVDDSATRSTLQWEPPVSVLEGLRQTGLWYKRASRDAE